MMYYFDEDDFCRAEEDDDILDFLPENLEEIKETTTDALIVFVMFLLLGWTGVHIILWVLSFYAR